MNSERSDVNSLSEAKRSDKACCWSITINNPNDDDMKQWASLASLPWVRGVTGQVEKGQEGTPHIQGMVRTQSVRFAQMKKALPRAHIEAARSLDALAKYVVKEETRIAPIAPIKTATQSDVQGVVLSLVLEDLYRHTKNDPLDTDELDMIMRNKERILKYWEVYLDDAVNVLIYRGYYGVEFVVSNPQIRTAFRKYLPAICYRTYNARIQEQETRSSQAAQVGGEGT